MNREIKFRVWDIELHMWINNIGMGKDNTLCKGTEKRFAVMQYIGLKDKMVMRFTKAIYFAMMNTKLGRGVGLSNFRTVFLVQNGFQM